METKKILRSRDVTFCEDPTIGDHLEDGPSGRSKERGVIVDTSSKSPIIVDEGEEGGESDALLVPMSSRTENGAKGVQQAQSNVEVEGPSSSGRRYPERLRKVLGEWWKNRTSLQVMKSMRMWPYWVVVHWPFVKPCKVRMRSSGSKPCKTNMGR